MKKLFFILLLALTLTACGSEDYTTVFSEVNTVILIFTVEEMAVQTLKMSGCIGHLILTIHPRMNRLSMKPDGLHFL